MMHVRVATTQTDLFPILQPLKKFVFWERDSETNFVDRLDRRMCYKTVSSWSAVRGIYKYKLLSDRDFPSS